MVQVIIDFKQGTYHQLGCSLVKVGNIINQAAHDFRLRDVKDDKELKREGFNLALNVMEV